MSKFKLVILLTLAFGILLLGLRAASSILEKEAVFDEQYITVPMFDLIEEGWSVDTAIDFEETKGPALIWPYAIVGNLFGGTLNDLRLVSLLASVASLFVLLLIALREQCSTKCLILIAIGWLLLPYNLVFSEIVMGEVSFVFFSLIAVYGYYIGSERGDGESKWLGMLCYGVALCVALHSRIHVVAIAGAICIHAFSKQRFRSLPWWCITLAAGLLRIPLWMRWGGLVSPEYQSLHGLGFRMQGTAYLLAALLPLTGVFAIEAWRKLNKTSGLFAMFAFGFILMLVAQPDLHIPETIDFDVPNERFQGIVATAAQLFSSNDFIQSLFLALCAGIGCSGLFGLWKLTTSEGNSTACELSVIVLTLGCALYLFTRGFVFDRFLYTWAFLLPIAWIKRLSPQLLIMQLLMLSVIAGRLVYVWLF